MTDRLEKLKKQQAQLKARIQSLEAGQKTRERKKETQRKTLFGAYMLEKLKRGDPVAESLRAELDGYLTRDHERALFELPPLPKAEGGKGVKKALPETA